MSTDSQQPVIATRDHSLFDEEDNPAPGSFNYYVNGSGAISGLLFACPCGYRTVHALNFDMGRRPRWKWVGNEEKPTLKPSIQITSGCRWHGFLHDGVFHPC